MASATEEIRVGPHPNHARPGRAAGQPTFAHPSEAQFASVLTFYGINWLYEPTTFPLAWSEDGRTTLAFSPDFYLPEFDLYIELATRKQGEMTLKNRKIRRLQELYPDVHIKLVNRRAFEDLLVKFGLEGRSSQLVGGIGHA